MPVKDVVDLFIKEIPRIFKKKKSKNFLEALGKGIDKKANLLTKLVPYTQDGLEEILNENFGNSMSNEVIHNGCIAGAVARQFNEDINHPDVLEIFDSKSEIPQLVQEIILGSTCAPMIFDTPRKIGLKNYIDGAVAGNCPLNMAVPRAFKIFGPNANLETVLSIATPDLEEKRLDDFKYSWQKSVFYIKYLSTRLVYGSPIFADCQKTYPNTLFIRAVNKTEEVAKFQMDDINVNAMLKVIDHEYENVPSYLLMVLDSAAVIAARTLTNTQSPEVDLLREIAEAMTKRGEFANAIFICNSVLQVSNQDLKANMDFNWILGHCHEEQDCFEEALKFYLKAMEYAKGFSNQDHIDLANLMKNIGQVKRDLGQLSESQHWLEKSLAAFKAAKADSIDIAHCLNSLGNCHKDQGKYQQALESYQQVQSVLTDYQDEQAKLIMSWVMNNMGSCHRHMSQYDKAMECLSESLEWKRRLHGVNACSEGIALTISNMAGILLAIGDFEQAKARYDQALVMKRAIFGKDAENSSLASTLHNYGNVSLQMGKFSQAMIYLNQALSMRRKFLGPKHLDVAKTLKVIGLAYLGMGESGKAKRHFEEALAIAKEAEGGERLVAKIQERLDCWTFETQYYFNSSSI